ncbi:MAG TPA: serine/threonine-protein kinase [Kofleriaceae bacterium]
MADSSPLAHSPTLAATKPRDDAERFAPGAQVGEYVIDRFLGAGAMGEVYAGKHPVIGKRVAIKVLRNDLAASAEAAERFIREARAVNQIEHENVVDVFAFGRLDDGRLYLVMDLVEGKSLRAALVDGPLDIDRALAILDTIASALDAAHERGVVHRDLKPDNIVLSSATPPKVFVLDFGIAKLISTANAGEKTGPGTLTGQGTWLGTPGYMAPEQWSIDGAGTASDRYALGVIAFELLSGSLPFSSTSVPGMMEQHFRADVPALSARGAVGVPAALDGVLRRALAKDPDARFATAREFVDALRAAAGSSAHRGRGAVAAPGGSRKLWLPALAGLGVLAVAVVVVIMSREPAQKPVAAPIDEDKPPPGQVALDVASTPIGAEVREAGRVRGTTPTKLYAKPGDTLDLVIDKPGYLSEPRKVTLQAADALHVNLVPVSGFDGVWKLANGELRRFKRNGDQVDVFKRTEAHGTDTFFKTYEFVRADRGVAFAIDDQVVDPRAPNDPRCHVKVHVQYHYDPSADALEQHRDKVKISFQDGSCTVQSREVEPTKLARAEAVNEVEIPAPVGKPVKRAEPVKQPPAKQPPAKPVTKKGKTIPLDPKQSLKQQKADELEAQNAQRNAPLNKEPSPNVKQPPPQQAPQPAPSQQSQILPQPQAPPPQVSEEPQQQRQKK